MAHRLSFLEPSPHHTRGLSFNVHMVVPPYHTYYLTIPIACLECCLLSTTTTTTTASTTTLSIILQHIHVGGILLPRRTRRRTFGAGPTRDPRGSRPGYGALMPCRSVASLLLLASANSHTRTHTFLSHTHAQTQIRVMMSTDNHLGYEENDSVRGTYVVQ